MTRRRFLLCAAAPLSSAAFLHSPQLRTAVAGQGRRLENIGIQLFTVRDRMSESVPETLDALAAIGYREVEFAGYFEHSPAEIGAFLRNAGLAAPSSHVPLEDIRSRPAQLIETAKDIGHEYLVLPWLPEDERTALDQYRAHAELCNRFAEQCHAGGLAFAYHNHDFEFENLDGVRPFDLLLSETDPDLVRFELDLYWIARGGGDPFAYFAAHPGRFPLCHVKDMAKDGSMADVGSGTIDFGAIFAATRKAGFLHYFVEHDDAPDPFASAAKSFAALSAMEY